MSLISTLILGFLVGVIARLITPGDFFRHYNGLVSWGISILVGLGGAVIGFLVFHVLLGWGDSSIFNWGSIVGSIIGAVILLIILTFVLNRRRRA